ncbi:MAG: hypothetical protein ACOX0M_07855 [Salinivirgaceae bacterium]|jgi:uncharacterized protein YifE (UPF0438 family)|nr:hypothetical protein [Bacteroidales bacterium]
MIPDKSKKEWLDLVTGKGDYKLTNFVLQMKVSQAINDVNSGRIKPQKAVDEIHSLFTKYEKATARDLEEIFG